LVEHLQATGLDGAGFFALNTDASGMGDNGAVTRIQLGTRLTRGLGAGGDPELGRAAAEEAIERVREVCQGAEMVFVLTGMGGGTGTGGAPVVARVARETGALVMGLATLPFACEGSRRQRQARRGIEEFKAASDAVLALPNQRVLSLIDENTSLLDTFGFIEALLAEGVRGLWRLVGRPGLINVDFADLREMMRDRHAESFFAYAETEGDARSRDIVERLTLNPLLENGSLLRTTGAALVSVVAGPSLTMAEVNRVTDLLRRECEDADLLLGATVDPALGERLSLTFIGIQRSPNRADEDFSAAEAGAPAKGASTAVEAESLETDFFHRKPPARRARSRFIAPPPELSPEECQKAVRGRRGRGRPRMQQAMLPLEVVSKGRFEKSEPTVHHGEDLDIPTFVRRGVVFN
jgi:cell division protein FtsZ